MVNIDLSPHVLQRILKRVGSMDSGWLGNDTYHCLIICDILVSYVGEDFLRVEMKKINKDWDKIKIELEDLSKKVQKVKPAYDIIQDKAFSKLDKESDKKEEFIRLASKIPLFGNKATWLYTWFVKNTPLQYQQVKNEYYNYLERSGYKVSDVRKKKHTEPVSEGTPAS